MRTFTIGLVTALACFHMGVTAQAQPTTPPSEMPAGAYQLELSHSSLLWKVWNLGMTHYTARFTKMSADLDFDPAAPENSKLTVNVDPTSVQTDYPYPKPDWNHEVAYGEGVLNSEKFPAITFVSTSIERTGDNTGKITGDLTLLGMTKPVILDATFNAGMAKHPFTQKPSMGFSATGTLNRSDWGMVAYIPGVSDEVTLEIQASFQQN